MGLLKMGDDYMVTINEVWISTVPEFLAILQRDRGNAKDGPSRFKRKAHRDFTYIYLMHDFDSDLSEMDYDEKEAEACRRTDRQPWQVQEDQLLQDAIRAFIKIQDNKSQAYRTYQKLQSANDRALAFIENLDLSETTDNGGVKYKPSEITTFIKSQPQVMKAMDEIKELARKQLSGEVGLRGQATKGFDEDPD